MAVWLRRLVGSSELVSRRQGSKSRRKLKFFPSFFLQLFKLQPPKIVFFFTFSVFSSLILRKKSNDGVLCISANLWKNRTIDRAQLRCGWKWPWLHFRTGIPPTFSFLYQGWQSIGKAGDLKTSWKIGNSNKRVVSWPRWKGKVKEGVHRQFTYLRLSIWRLSKYS